MYLGDYKVYTMQKIQLKIPWKFIHWVDSRLIILEISGWLLVVSSFWFLLRSWSLGPDIEPLLWALHCLWRLLKMLYFPLPLVSYYFCVCVCVCGFYVNPFFFPLEFNLKTYLTPSAHQEKCPPQTCHLVMPPPTNHPFHYPLFISQSQVYLMFCHPH